MVDARAGSTETLLTSDDLVPDRALTGSDEDAFDYEPIAARVADLAMLAPTPTNIAIYGSWGSGKSSFGELLRRCLALRNLESPIRKVAFVRYEAWRYQGESLKRNFIAHCAKAFGLSPSKFPQFYRGLYQEASTVELDLRRGVITGLKVLGLALITVTVVMCVWFGADLAQALASNHSVRKAWRGTLGDFMAPLRASAFLIAVLTVFAAVARVELKRTAPSTDEEFAERFAELVERAVEATETDRLLFFIDELDRCSAEEVVEVLSAVKTFLDVDRSVFVIAADREVIEGSLRDKLTQPTTISENHPYYTTAASFLEKIFQYSINLPPFRGRRLTTFALDLVSERKGLWSQLRESKGRPALEEVVVALVPSHVRSPRQIKQLLNNFASNARVAQGRGIDHLGRAEEIAKLTALESEFPTFAAAIRQDRRLLRILKEPGLVTSGELRGVLRSLSEISSVRGNAPRELVERQVDDLVRYLQRTASIKGPSADLVYLGHVAPEIDPAEPDLGEELELLATDSPVEAAELLAQRSIDIRIGALGFLAGMLGETFATERKNVMTTLARVASTVGGGEIERLAIVGPAVRSYSLDQSLDGPQLLGALLIGRAIEGPDGGQLSFIILDDEELWSEDERATAALGLLHEFHAAPIRRGLTRLKEIGISSVVAVGAIHILNGIAWSTFIDLIGPLLQTRLKTLESAPDECRQLAQEMLTAAQSRSEKLIGADTIRLLTASGSPIAYGEAKSRAVAILSSP